VIGYIGAIVASLFFGSNYVPTKNYPQGDGFTFVWVFSSGVLTVGILSMFIAGKAIFVYTGLIGGTFWAMGNLCVIPIIKFIGLGLGLLLWGSASLITGFLMGKTGFLGLPKDDVSNPAMNWAGFLLVVSAMAIFFFIKPTLEEKNTEKLPLLQKDTSKYSIQDGATPLPVDSEQKSIFDGVNVPEHLKLPLGISLAIFSGILYGVNMIPMSLWVKKQTEENGHAPGPLDFVFSHFVGIYIFSTAVFLIYCVIQRKPIVFPESIIPSYISGAMWGIAQCGLMSATQILGYTIGFPIGSAGPLIVSSLWSVLYFREIRGLRNLLFLGASFALLGTGIVLLPLSQRQKK